VKARAGTTSSNHHSLRLSWRGEQDRGAKQNLSSKRESISTFHLYCRHGRPTTWPISATPTKPYQPSTWFPSSSLKGKDVRTSDFPDNGWPRAEPEDLLPSPAHPPTFRCNGAHGTLVRPCLSYRTRARSKYGVTLTRCCRGWLQMATLADSGVSGSSGATTDMSFRTGR
jgi:hypothetical protein